MGNSEFEENIEQESALFEAEILDVEILESDDEVLAPQAPVVSMESLPITGEARVDDALGRLADLQGLPVHEHADVFVDVQRRLHNTLADLAGQ